MFFFEFYESGNLADKLHVEEWSPGIDQALMITVQLGKYIFFFFSLDGFLSVVLLGVGTFINRVSC